MRLPEKVLTKTKEDKQKALQQRLLWLTKQSLANAHHELRGGWEALMFNPLPEQVVPQVLQAVVMNHINEWDNQILLIQGLCHYCSAEFEPHPFRRFANTVNNMRGERGMSNHLNFLAAILVGSINAFAFPSSGIAEAPRDARRLFFIFLRNIIHDPTFAFDKVPDWMFSKMTGAITVLVKLLNDDEPAQLLRALMNVTPDQTRPWSKLSECGKKLLNDIGFKVFNNMPEEDRLWTLMYPTFPSNANNTPHSAPRMKRTRRPGICKRPQVAAAKK